MKERKDTTRQVLLKKSNQTDGATYGKPRCLLAAPPNGRPRCLTDHRPCPAGAIHGPLPTLTTHDPVVACCLANISAWSYSDKNTFCRQLGLKSQDVLHYQTKNAALCIDTEAYLVQTPSNGPDVVVFRGTELDTVIDLLTGANWKAASHPLGGRVHRGFEVAERFIAKDILADLTPTAVYLTGHSLGGALAVLFAATMLETNHGSRIQGVYTFGQPKVGNKEFSRVIEQLRRNTQADFHIFRHVLACDPVPLIPPPPLDFSHLGHLYQAGKAPLAVSKAPPTNSPQWARLRDAWANVMPKREKREAETPAGALNRLLDSLDDHSPAEYIEFSRNFEWRTTR